jgi:AraC-like DNA-binding protein
VAIVRVQPSPPLDRYIECLWYSSRVSDQCFGENMLPSGRGQLIFSLSDAHFTYTDKAQKRVTWSGSIVHGPQWRHFVAGPKPAGAVVGVSFRPGFAGPLLGISSSELADQHVSLNSLWGTRADELRQRLLSDPEPLTVFQLLQRYLRARVDRPLLMHPAIAPALTQSWLPDRVSSIQSSSGYSAKHFIALFRNSVGLTPKHYFRIQRFNAVARKLAGPAKQNLAQLAADFGYADQAHLTREFRELAGVTPSHYRGRAESPLHHPAEIPGIESPFR